MKIKFWGTRGSIPVPGRETSIYGGNTTCLQITTDKTLLIIDTGTGVRKLGIELCKQTKFKTINILYTHFHWDHVQGFPFFQPIFIPDFNVNIFGYVPKKQILSEIMQRQMNSPFCPVDFKKLKAKINIAAYDNDFKIGDIDIKSIANQHPNGSQALRFFHQKKDFSFITDNELGLLQKQKNWPEFLSFFESTQILIHDGMYINEEMPNVTGWGHSSIDEVFDLCQKVSAQKGIYTHHNTERTDSELKKIEKEYSKKAKQYKKRFSFFAAKEGMELTV